MELRQVPEPEEQAEIVAFLCGPAAWLVTGWAVIVVEGWSAR